MPAETATLAGCDGLSLTGTTPGRPPRYRSNGNEQPTDQRTPYGRDRVNDIHGSHQRCRIELHCVPQPLSGDDAQADWKQEHVRSDQYRDEYHDPEGHRAARERFLFPGRHPDMTRRHTAVPITSPATNANPGVYPTQYPASGGSCTGTTVATSR